MLSVGDSIFLRWIRTALRENSPSRCSATTPLPFEPGDYLDEHKTPRPADEKAGHPFSLELVHSPKTAVEFLG